MAWYNLWTIVIVALVANVFVLSLLRQWRYEIALEIKRNALAYRESLKYSNSGYDRIRGGGG